MLRKVAFVLGSILLATQATEVAEVCSFACGFETVNFVSQTGVMCSTIYR
jgi:hypothetical protein